MSPFDYWQEQGANFNMAATVFLFAIGQDLSQLCGALENRQSALITIKCGFYPILDVYLL